MAADLRLAAQGSFKIGLPEVKIGMTMPGFGIELAQARLSPTHLQRAVACAEIFNPDGALAAGFVDRLVPAEEFEQQVFAEASAYAALSPVAHRATKLALRADSIVRLRTSLDNFTL